MVHCRKENLIHFAVTIISKDRPGIVADTTEVLFRLGCNLEDTSCTMLGGDFAMILMVSHELPFSESRLVEEFDQLQREKGLAIHIRTLEPEEICPIKPEGELCLVSVYGSDQPGIIYRVTKELAARKVNITDLNSRLVGSVQEPVYVLMLEALLPAGMAVEDVEGLLAELKQELQVEIGVRSITPVEL